MNLKRMIQKHYAIAAATSSSESDIESDGMCDWSASECEDYKVGIATMACAAPDSMKTLKDTWEWRGPCCLVRVQSTIDVCLHLHGRKTPDKASPYNLNKLPM